MRLGPLLQRLEVRALVAWGAAAASLWAFLVIGGEVLEGETSGLDRWLLLALRAPGRPADLIGPAWLQEAMRDITALGGTTLLVLLGLTATVWLVFRGLRRQALVLVATLALAQLSSEVLKTVYDRPRPTLVPHGVHVYSLSFPSGHSTLSTAAFLTVASIVASLQSRRREKVFVYGLAFVLAAAVGFSRVYLGVHWPTDVFAGWALGSLWALAALLALPRPRRDESA